MKLLDRVHHNAARIVTGATTKCKTSDLLKEAGWETLYERCTEHRATFMYNILNGRTPPYLLDLIPNTVEARNRYRYSLRNRGDLVVPYARLTTYSNSFFPATTRKWNELPLSVKNSPSHLSFKCNYLKQFPRPPINKLFYIGPRKEAMAHAKLRIGCSLLNAHLHYYLHVIESPLCSCNMGVDETTNHYLFTCPLYTNQRKIMLDKVHALNIVEISAK
jgi:hypothetical protein